MIFFVTNIYLLAIMGSLFEDCGSIKHIFTYESIKRMLNGGFVSFVLLGFFIVFFSFYFFVGRMIVKYVKEFDENN